ncbi:MAG: hypothetical protein WED83_09665 [Acidimicrobiia bacterium]
MAAAILGFTLVAIFSGVVNGVELTRTLSATILWTEPLLVAYVIWVALVRSADPRKLGRSGTYLFVVVILAEVLMMTLQIPRQMSLPGGDWMQGTFLGSGTGAHVAPAVAFLGIVLVLESATLDPRRRWLKLLFCAYGLLITSLALARAVTAIYAVALILGTIIVGSRRSAKRWSAVAISLLIGIGFWLAFPLLGNVPDVERQLPGWEVKVSGIKSIIEDMQSNPSYAVAGQGPGTTLSRVAMQTPEANLNLASPVASLGLGTTEFTRKIVHTRSGVDIAQSSLFSPSSTLVGVLGDLGVVGLVMYVAMWLPLLRTTMEVSRGRGRYGVPVIVIATVVLGSLQIWLEEPGYVLSVALLLALVAGNGFYPAFLVKGGEREDPSGRRHRWRVPGG